MAALMFKQNRGLFGLKLHYEAVPVISGILLASHWPMADSRVASLTMASLLELFITSRERLHQLAMEKAHSFN